MKTISTFWDHSQHWVWQWFWQMLTRRNVFFFYDFKKKCFVRKVINVPGFISFDIYSMRLIFYPYFNKIVNYGQLL